MINNKLLDKIKAYCELNNIEIQVYINDLLEKAFMIDLYGEKPPVFNKNESEEKEISQNSNIQTSKKTQNSNKKQIIVDETPKKEERPVKNKEQDNSKEESQCKTTRKRKLS